MEDKCYQVVVIGSGFGGAVTACRLAEAGISVCILERGRRWDRKSKFPRSLDQLADGLWQDGKSFGFIEYLTFENMDVIQGSGVGGGSLHYYNVHLRAPAKIFADGRWPKNITREKLDPYYEKVKDMLEAEPLKGPDKTRRPYEYDLPTRTQAFHEAVGNSGREWVAENVALAVYTGAPRQHPISTEQSQSPCDHTGFCLMGCRINAKNTLDLNYIATAEQHGAVVFPLHKVVDIRPPEAGSGYQVFFEKYPDNDPLDTDGNVKPTETRSFYGEKVIVAAGAIGSTKLLLRCKRAGLTELRPQLGKRFSGNGDFLLGATVDANRDVDPGQGPTITAGVDCSTDKYQIYIEDLGYPNPFMWLLNAVIPNKERSLDALTLAMRYLAVDRGQSTEHPSLGAHAALVLKGGVTSRCLPYLGMGMDASDGVLSFPDIIVTHIFEGKITGNNTNLYPGVSVGDPFRAVLTYDPSQLPAWTDLGVARYNNYKFELSVGDLNFSNAFGQLVVVKPTEPPSEYLVDSFFDSSGLWGFAKFFLRGGSGTVFSSTDLPTSLDISDFKDSSEVMVWQGVEGKSKIIGKITSIVSKKKAGTLELMWDHESSREMFSDMERAMKDLSKGLGGKYLPSVYWAADRLLTAHPLGGCAMGDDPEFDVVNEYGEVNGYPGLYVADGAIIPTALARNPTATIAALAERIAEHIVEAIKAEEQPKP